MSPVLRLCSRHRTFSQGRFPQCASDRYERRRAHVRAEGKKFRRAILDARSSSAMTSSVTGVAVRRTVDYVRALVEGGEPFDEGNEVASRLPPWSQNPHGLAAEASDFRPDPIQKGSS